MSEQGVADELKFVIADKTRQIEKLEAELLSLRTMRDAGDEEVERLTNEIQYQLRTEDIIRLHDIAITARQQLREIRESCPCNCHNQPSSKEAMGLDEHSNCGECIKGLLEEAEAMQDSLCEKYESELREAQAEIEKLNQIIRELKDNFGEMEVGA